MKRYGIVHFRYGGEKGAKQQRWLTEQLRAQGIIDIENSQIQKWFQLDRNTMIGSIHKIVLHNAEETEQFVTIMGSEQMRDENIEWKVSRSPNDRIFAKWLKSPDDKDWYEEYLKSEEQQDGVCEKV